MERFGDNLGVSQLVECQFCNQKEKLMSYLHCHKCGWRQDDFWSLDGYTPFRTDFINQLKECLFKDKVYIYEETISSFQMLGFLVKDDSEGFYVKGTDYVAGKLMWKADNIAKMKVLTREDWKKAKDDFVCPQCGSGDNLDID